MWVGTQFFIHLPLTALECTAGYKIHQLKLATCLCLQNDAWSCDCWDFSVKGQCFKHGGFGMEVQYHVANFKAIYCHTMAWKHGKLCRGVGEGPEGSRGCQYRASGAALLGQSQRQREGREFNPDSSSQLPHRKWRPTSASVGKGEFLSFQGSLFIEFVILILLQSIF